MESTMRVRTPKILSFEKVRDIKPDSGSGTGYNQYTVIRIKYDSMIPTDLNQILYDTRRNLHLRECP